MLGAIASIAALSLVGCSPDSPPATTLAPAPSLGDRLTMGIFAQEEMPYTKESAEEKNWIKVGGDDCDPNFGHRFRLSGRITPTIIYNNLGEIAGFQGVVNPSTYPLYPETNLKAPDIQELGSDEAGHTFFFKDPTLICSAPARVETDVTASGLTLGDRLWIRSGNLDNSGDINYVNIPLAQDSNLVNDGMPDIYSASGCAPTGWAFPGSPGMGTHHWGNLTNGLGLDGAIQDSGPLAIMYSDKKLRALALSYSGRDGNVPTVGGVLPVRDERGNWNVDKPELWEFGQQPMYPTFFDTKENMPRWLENVNQWNATLPNGTLTTASMHIFFSDPYTITCP